MALRLVGRGRIAVDGGYYSFDTNGKLNGCHYYIQDYQGNNRMVVNASTNDIEQINHYYSYGGLMGVISTKPNAQNFKYGGKELDLSNGLNLYDFEARQYDSGAPDFTSVDPLAEKYCGISPYAYCAGDPINLIDPTGMNPIYDQHGNFLGCTSEGFTGEVIIYNGEEEFDAQSARNMTSDEFIYGSFGCAQYGLSSLCASSVEKVWNHILRQFLGKKIFLPLSEQARQEDEEYDEDDYPEDAIFSVNDRWKVRYDRNKTGPAHWTTNLGTGNIYGSNSNVGGDYESTVENIVCSVIPHEWWGHAKKSGATITKNIENVMKHPCSAYGITIPLPNINLFVINNITNM